jgi:hypothetical protein
MPAVLGYLLLAFFALPSYALHFYMHGGTPKCFVEELPKDTLVVGTSLILGVCELVKEIGKHIH